MLDKVVVNVEIDPLGSVSFIDARKQRIRHVQQRKQTERERD